MSSKTWIGLLVLAICAALCWRPSSQSPPSKQDRATIKSAIVSPAPGAQSDAPNAAPPPAWFYPMEMDVAGVSEPELETAEEADLDEEAIVIGIVVHGEPRAYLREAFEMSPRLHVVTDSIDSMPVTITHCDRIRCTRVFTGPELQQPGTIRVGGWRDDQTLALIVNEQEYSQKSAEIPLADVPFLEMPWGMWRELFPDTLVYLGTGGRGDG